MNLSTKSPQPSAELQHSAGKRSSRAEQPQDRWFDEQLNQLFENVVNEPMPSDLADLIGRLKSQDQKK